MSDEAISQLTQDGVLRAGINLGNGLLVTGKAAEMRSKTKQHRERHWDGSSLKDILSQIAAEHGLEPKIDDEKMNQDPGGTVVVVIRPPLPESPR